ncbi:MAG TPA: FtsX-like permease family protein, partial [Bradyrhizobium sp.]|nr:FtsX-like permease family protein [Bradyrhizobium sp.]
IALGARLGQVVQSVIASGLRLVVTGGAIGIVVSIVALRPLGALLFRVTPYDPITYVSVAALLCAVASLASYVPARQAARVDPLVALRHE